MPVEQGLPWHPVATGLAGQAIPFIVAASHAHTPPYAPFWSPVPAVLVASPALLCPSSLSGVPALVPLGVAPAFCVSVLLLPLSGGAPGCPCRAPPPVPPACPPHTRISHLRTTWTAPCAVGCSRCLVKQGARSRSNYASLTQQTSKTKKMPYTNTRHPRTRTAGTSHRRRTQIENIGRDGLRQGLAICLQRTARICADNGIGAQINSGGHQFPNLLPKSHCAAQQSENA